jgi:hypothetical protein
MGVKRLDRDARRREIADEAEYWDATDTSDLMAQETEWAKIEWSSQDDRCDRCGGRMLPRAIDLRLSNGRVILRQVTWYVCHTPGCGQTRLAPAITALADEIESLVQRTLAGGTLRPTLSKQQPGSHVREDATEYGSSESESK